MTKLAAVSDPALARIRIPFVKRAVLLCRGREEDAFIVDLGLSGVFVERYEPLPRGEAVVVRFRLPGNAIAIEAPCEVAWSQAPGTPSHGLPPGVGLHFSGLADADRERLSEHLAEHCRLHGKARRFTRPWPLPGTPESGGEGVS
jgi:Tfp pilus assembly protein PilZ